MPDRMMDGGWSPRTVLCLLAGVGALAGGVAGAVLAGRLSTEDPLPAAMARDEPATAAGTAGAAAMAARSALRQPTPWSAANARAVRVRVDHPQPRTRRGAAAARAKRRPTPPVRAATSPVAMPTSTETAPQGGVPAATTNGAGTAPIRTQRPPAPAAARSPAPEPSPKASKPAPERAPAPKPSPTPEPQPTGTFDDSG